MIKVTLVTNNGDGVPATFPVAEGTELDDFLKVHFDGDLEDFTVRVRSNGESVEAGDYYVLQDEDRVSIAPRKIDGAR